MPGPNRGSTSKAERPASSCATAGWALWDAVLSDRAEVASRLVRSGLVDLNAQPTSARPASFLHEVVKRQHPSYRRLAALMIRRGADVNAPDLDGAALGYTPLLYAVRAKSTIRTIRQLLRRGARVNSPVIREASSHPRAAQLIATLVGGFDEEAASRTGQIDDALFACSLHGMDEEAVLPSVKLMLDTELAVARAPKARHTLLLAIRTNKPKMVQLLVERGFDVNAAGWGGILPIIAASSLEGSATSELLIEAGADVHSAATDGRYPIHVACESHSAENIRLLVRHGADLSNLVEPWKRTPLSLMAAEAGVSAAHRVVIGHLALLVETRGRVDDADLSLIHSHPEFRAFYYQCTDELERMRNKTILDDLSFFAVFRATIGELAFLARKRQFVDNYTRHEFPIYAEQLKHLYDKALRRKEMLSDKELSLRESLEMTLPYVSLEKIVHFLYLNDSE